jgi:hypothetical protein
MPNNPITTIPELHEHLKVAMQLEHATIPPYLLALYTIHPDTNLEATRILRTVVVEEMLHLTLAANIFNAVDGTPNLLASDFVPQYPAPLPDGETDFKVSLRPFSCAAVDTFLNIERPRKAPTPDKRMIHKGARRFAFTLQHPEDPKHELAYYSIGEFYDAIADGLRYLNNKHSKGGSPLFRDKNQVGPKYYYSGGAHLIEVNDLKTALKAIHTIIQQGEGFDREEGGEFIRSIVTNDGELSHDFRFEQLKLGRYYLTKNAEGKPDKPGHPTGPELKVDWDAVYPTKVNAKLSDYTDYPELHAAAVAFNREYFCFLRLLNSAYNGQPNLLLTDAVPKMFALRNLMLQLIHVPMPGMTGFNAAPTFEMPHEEIICPEKVTQ